MEARVLRPGRRVEQVEATLLRAADREPLMRCTAWTMRSEDVEIPAGAVDREPPPPGPESGTQRSFGFWTEPVAYHSAFDWSWIDGAFDSRAPRPSGRG